MKKLIFLLSIIIIAFVSCKKGGLNDVSHDRLQSLLLGKDTLQLYVGENRQLPLTITPSNYHTDSIKWKSSDSTIISISNTGLLSAKKIGSSIITVSNLTNTISVNCLISVGPAPIDSLAVGLIAYYPFTNSSAADSSGNGNNGTAFNVTPVSDRFGNANAAFYFDGDNSNYIIVKNNSQMSLHNTNYSINLWVKIDQYSANYGGVIFTKRYNGEAGGLDLSISNPVDVKPTGTVYYGPGGPFPGAYGIGLIGSGSWNMITLVYDYAAEQTTIYENGVFDSTSSGIVSPNSLSDLYFGRDNPANQTGPTYNLRGTLDDISVYNRKLSVKEVTELYGHTSAPLNSKARK